MEALSELRELDDQAVIARPEGQSYRIRGKADMSGKVSTEELLRLIRESA